MKRNLSKLFLDLSKILFAGVMLSIVFEPEHKKSIILYGSILLVLFAVVGFGILRTKEE